jgi:putative cell wall-binding protein
MVDQPRLQRAADSVQVVAERSSTLTQDYGLVGVTWAAGSAPEDLLVQVRTRTGGEWKPWQALDVVEMQPTESDARGGTDPIWVGESDGVGVRLLSAGSAPEDVSVSLIDGGTGLVEPAIELMGYTPPTQGVTEKPLIVTRRQWGVDRSTEVDCSTPRISPGQKGIVLHHTAGSNGYTAEQSPGIVRATHRYHTASLGWCDIGYNFLVDAFGTIYEGRRGGINKAVRGAHAGNWEANEWTTGISMMGNYDTVAVPEATKNAVIKLAAWRLSYFGLDAVGKTYISGKYIDIISGHRDLYISGMRPATATACPGRYGYEWLNGGMRDKVQARIDAVAPAEPVEEPADEQPTEEPVAEEPVEEPVAEQPPVMSRLSGQSRYATAAAISKGTFSVKGEVVFLASGDTFPDALSAGPAAAKRSAPILLTAKEELPAETISELRRLAPRRIYVLGGELTVSPQVEAAASAYAESVVRLAGQDRYQTGVAISQKLWKAAETVYIASGTTYPDALSGGALAARDGAPVLLSAGEQLPESIEVELRRLQPTRVVLLGGELTLSTDVQIQVGQAVPSATVSRLNGRDRYETSAVITTAGWESAGTAYFAAGTKFPDALAGVPAAAMRGAPLLLTTRRCMPPAIADVVEQLGVTDRVVLGGSLSLRSGGVNRTCD